MYVSIASAHLVYQFWVHTQHIPKLGVFEWFFVTPSNHRVHHAQNADYIDKNYGGLLIVWDRLFGTFEEEQEDQSPIYGIRTPLKSWNPLWANIHIYADMASDAWRAKKWKDKARVFWARTGWQPPDVAKNYPREKSDLERFEKYGRTLTTTTNIAVIAQYLLVSFFHFWGAQNASQLGLEVLWLTVVAQAYTLWVIGAVLDGKQLSRPLEYSRLLLLSLGLLICFWTNLISIDWLYGGWLILLTSGSLMLCCLPPKSYKFASIKTFN